MHRGDQESCSKLQAYLGLRRQRRVRSPVMLMQCSLLPSWPALPAADNQDLAEFKGCSRCSPPTQGAERCVMRRFATTQPTCSHTSPSGFVVTEQTHAHTHAHTHTHANTHYSAAKTLLRYNIINCLFRS